MRFPFQVLRVSSLFPASVGDPDEGRGGNEPLSAVAIVSCVVVCIFWRHKFNHGSIVSHGS